jgi:hypothetical protein
LPVDWTQRALEPYSVPAPTPVADPYIGTYATQAKITVVEGPPTAKIVHPLPDLVELKATATPAKVTVTFSLGSVKGTAAEASAYKVERQEGSGGWKPLPVAVDAQKHEFSDDSVEPDTAYRYRITATTKDTLADRSTVAAVIPVSVPGLWTLKIVSLTPDREEEGKGEAFIEVTRVDKASGETLSERFIVHEKAGSGEHRVGFDRDGKSQRTRMINGKAVVFDFDCGFDLESVKPGKITLVSRANPKIKKVITTP